MRGSLPTGNARIRTAESSAGRTCAEEGCGTRLSVYNSAERCWQHADVVFPNFRGRRVTGN